MKKHDWRKIKILFIEGYNNNGKIVFPTLRELSERCGVNYSYLKHYAGKENWTQQRETYSAKLALKRLEKKSGLLANEGAEFDFRTLELAKAGILQIKAYFLVHKKLMRKAKKDKKNIPLLNYKAIESLSKALSLFQRIGKLVLNEQLPPEKIQSKEVLEFRREIKKYTPEERARLATIIIKAEKEFMESNKDINNGDSKH